MKKSTSEKKSYYDVLGVSKDASVEEIKKRYLKIMLQCHPDRLINESEENKKLGEKRAKEANEAWDVLQDAQKREAYDNFGEDGMMGGGFPGGMNDIIS